MKNHSYEIIKKTNNSLVIKIHNNDIINESFIKSLFNNSYTEIVIRPATWSIQNSITLKDSLDLTKFYIQTGYILDKDNIINPQPTNKYNIIETHFNSKQELNDTLLKTMFESFINKWKPYTDETNFKEHKYYVENIFKLENTWLLKFNSNHAGMISLFSSSDCLEKKLTQVGWIWIDENLDKDVRIAVQRKISNIIKAYPDKVFQAGVAIFNIRSQKLFSKFGFNLNCLHITKK